MFGIVTMVLMLIFLPMFLSTYLSVAERNDMPIKAVSSLQPGQHVKIEGTIRSNGSIPIFGHREENEGGVLDWKFQTLPTMNVSDASGIIEVDLGNYSRIYEGPSTSVDSLDRNVSEYRDGDHVSVIGTVETTGSGTLRIRAEYISKDARSFGEALPELLWFMGAMEIIGIMLIIAGFWLNRKRVTLYRSSGLEQKAVATWPAATGATPAPSLPPGGIEWVVNEQREYFLRMRIKIIFIGTAVLVPLLGIFFYAFFSGQTCLCTILPFLLLFPAMFILVFATFESKVPTRIGFSRTGLHVEYLKPPTISSLFTFIRWSDIIDIAYTRSPFFKKEEDLLTKSYRLQFNLRPAGRVILPEINKPLATEVLRRFYETRPKEADLEKMARIKQLTGQNPRDGW